MKRTALRVMSAGLILAVAGRADAQEPPISRLLPEVVKLSAVVGQGETGDHRQHFVGGLFDARVIHDINRAILFQAAAFPLGPTSAAVTTPSTATAPRLFGTGYTDTGFSLGLKRLLIGVSYQSTTFAKLDGLDLRDTAITLYIPHGPATGDESDRDMLQQFVSLRLNRKVGAVSLAYGVNDRIDLGAVVPFVQMDSDVRVLTQVIRTASAQTPAVHEFNILDGGHSVLGRYCRSDVDPSLLECHASSTARGIGDIVLRGKATLVQAPASALAVSIDARLPTGNADEMIGLGATQLTPAVVWSADAGRVGVRARGDYTWSSGTLTPLLAEDASDIDLEIPDEMGFGFGLDAHVARWTTVSFDVLGRRMTNVREFTRGTVTFASRGPGALPSAPFVADDALLAGATRDVTQITTALGLRFDLSSGFVAQVSALIPTGSAGLRPQTTAVFSLTKRY